MNYSDMHFYVGVAPYANIEKDGRIDNILFYELDSSYQINSDGLIICSTETIETSLEYTCFLLRGIDRDEIMPSLIYPGAGLSASICHFDNDLPLYYLHQAQYVLGLIEHFTLKPLFALCLSYSYDFCLLVPTKSISTALSGIIHNQIEQWLDRQSTLSSADNMYNLKQLEFLSQRVGQRLFSQSIYRSNPQFRKQAQTIISLIEADVKNDDEAGELYLIAALCLQGMLSEIRQRWANEAGELHYEETSATEFYESISNRKAGDIRLFIEQSSPKSRWHDLIWSIIFVTRGILSAMPTKNKRLVSLSRVRKYEYLKDKTNFYGFLPIVSEHYLEISSYYHDHMSPSYNFGFLAIPPRCAHSFLSFFPAYIHELFHYISPSNRHDRNEVILKLAIHSVLNPLYTHLASSKRQVIYDRVHRLIYYSCKELSDYFEPNEISDSNDIDSMYYIIKMQCLQMLDFGRCYEHATSYFSDDEEFNSIRLECIGRWEDFDSYLRTFVVALREIRSDISMCHFLWKDVDNGETALKRYIAILASEPSFAKYNPDLTADSTILRFGFVTRYLIRQMYKGADDLTLLNLWVDNVCDVIRRLRVSKRKGECSFASCDELKCMTIEKLNNLMQYIAEYKKIALIIPKDDNTRVSSIFEKLLYSKMSVLIHDSQKDLVSVWEADISGAVSHRFPRELKRIYLKYERALLQGDRERMLYMDLNSRLIFRRLFLYFENIGF